MKKQRIVYQSEGTDDQRIICSTVEEAINCFRGDAGAILDGQSFGNQLTIYLSLKEMTDAQVAAIEEV